MKILLVASACLFSLLSAAQQKLQHVSTTANSRSNSTYIDDKGLNNNPKAIIIVEYDAKTAAANPHPVGVWYNGSQWAIFNQDMATMPAGLTFNLSWKNPDANTLYQKLSAANNVNGKLALDHPMLNNNPAARFNVSQVWNPEGQGGVYNNSNITAEYDANAGKWMVKNQNGSALANGASFNIQVEAATSNINIAGKKTIDPKVINNANNNPAVTINTQEVLTVIATDKANLNFENPLTGSWTATGTAFANQPAKGTTIASERVLSGMNIAAGGLGGDYWKNLDYPIGVKGNAWIGTYENGNGDGPTGTLTSKPFTVNGNYLTFLMGGGKDIGKLYVELQVKKTDYEAVWGAGKKSLFGETPDGFMKLTRETPAFNSEELFRYYFDLSGLLNKQQNGKTIRIVIVDDKTTGWGHINVDDIKFDNDLSGYLSIQKGGFGLLADADKPVWGYFDSHAHPAADEAFGKKYYVGSSRTPLSTTWSNEICTGAHTWGRTLDGFTNVFDPHKFFDGGWPDMWGFPKFNGKLHQKYQVDLIKRAWQGGLKIFCALGINNMYLATRALGHGTNGEPIDDESVLLRQVNVMKQMAAENSSWMEIAYTPADARRIILEGKLCVILGLEADVFGNFKSPDCVWGDRREDKPLVTITENNANALLEQKLDEYYRIGLRQVLPLHYLSKPFGGTAAFNGNTFLPQMNFYQNIRVKSGVNDRIGFNMYEDFPGMAALVGDALFFPDFAGRIQKQDEGAEISTVSADGLTPVGRTLFKKLMKKGFIIDQEHASYESKRGIVSLSQSNSNYPIMASHCGPQGLSFIWTGAPVRFAGSKEEKLRNFNTSTIRFVSHEMELNDESMNAIRETQGTIGVFTLLNHKRKYNGRWGNIPNDCPGSTKTVAQMYCYTLDKMNGKGVGLASDLPMVDGVSPRFGPYAAWALTTEDDDALKVQQRTQNRFAQSNGVRYDVPSKSYHHDFFQGGQIDGFEEDVWKALAAFEAGANAITNEGSVSESSDALHRGRIRNMVKGLNSAAQNQLMQPGVFTGDGPWEQAAMFCLNNNLRPDQLTVYDGGGKNETAKMYNKILPVWNLWKAKTGSNEPLRRCITGNRYWDFNLDGLAHYGLMPDLLQDLKNIGFTRTQLVPLFSSAEDYIQMWEKAEATKGLVRE